MQNVIDTSSNETDWAFVANVLDQFRKDTVYLNNNREEWTKEHPDHWVIVFREERVSVSPTLEGAIKDAEGQGVPCNLAARELLSSKTYDLIL